MYLNSTHSGIFIAPFLRSSGISADATGSDPGMIVVSLPAGLNNSVHTVVSGPDDHSAGSDVPDIAGAGISEGCFEPSAFASVPANPSLNLLRGMITDNCGAGNSGDVTLFFESPDLIEGNEPVSSIDFTGNDRIEFDDIAALNRKV